MKMWSGRFRQPLDPNLKNGSGRFPTTKAAAVELAPAGRMRTRLPTLECFPPKSLLRLSKRSRKLAAAASLRPKFSPHPDRRRTFGEDSPRRPISRAL